MLMIVVYISNIIICTTLKYMYYILYVWCTLVYVLYISNFIDNALQVIVFKTMWK